MKIHAKYLVLPLLLLTSACAEMENWSPTVDVASDPNADRLNSDMGQCRQLAHHAADTGDNVATDTVVGTVGGAAGGAAISAMVGNPAAGAAIGAVGGAGAGLLGGGL